MGIVIGDCFDFPSRSELLNFKGSTIIEDASSQSIYLLNNAECLHGLKLVVVSMK